jgi:hypothetical protein
MIAPTYPYTGSLDMLVIFVREMLWNNRVGSIYKNGSNNETNFYIFLKKVFPFKKFFLLGPLQSSYAETL